MSVQKALENTTHKKKKKKKTLIYITFDQTTMESGINLTVTVL